MERKTSFARSAAAGAAAAGAATVAFHPVDTLKTALQHSGRGGALGVARSLGIRGVYRGVLPAAFSMAPACAVRMGVYESVKAPLLQSSGLPPALAAAAASGFSVLASALVRAPLDLVKTQMQAAAAAGAPGASALQLLRNAWREAGLRGVYRGAGLALLRDVPFFSINLALYEQLRAAVRRRRGEITGGEALVLGAVAQGCAGFATNPVDVLKTRVQAAAGTGAPMGVGAALRAVLKGAGPGGLLRGALLRVAWVGPQGCVYYPVYELVQRL